MRICFITSCLEPGRDGVGDYARLLAAECIRQGHECCLVSMNDSFLTQPSQSIDTNEVKIYTLRLPASISWHQRSSHVEKFLYLFQPDWVSLQFVPYGFQDKGLVVGLSKWLRPLIQGRHLHIMFHELWIGQSVGTSLKEQLVGAVQKHFVLRLIKQLKPNLIHTSNATYVALLQQIGVISDCLPIFSNIPVADNNGDNWIFPKLQKLGLNINLENRTQFWFFGFFGNLPPTWPAEPLFTSLHQAGIQHQRKIVVISIGLLRAGEILWESLSKKYSHNFTFLQLGEQLPNRVSEFLNSIDFGIATSPDIVIGKSGTVAAMLEHGLPVIVNWYGAPLTTNWGTVSKIKLQDYEPLVYKIDKNFANKIKSLSRLPSRSRLTTTTAQLINDLGQKLRA